MKATTAVEVLPGFEDLPLLPAPRNPVPNPVVRAGEDSITPIAGVILWGSLLDRLGLAEEGDVRGVREIGPGGYTGGDCYRPLIETLLAGGDFLSDRDLLADEATKRLRGDLPLPSHTTQWRFLAGADLGRVMRIGATNREMLRRAWAMGCVPEKGLLTIDPDATLVDTYGYHKEGSTHTYKGKVGMHPLVGVIGETGDIVAVRARGGNAQANRKLASFTTECIQAIPKEVRHNYQLWVRCDSAGYQHEVIESAEAAGAVWSVTAKRFPNVNQAIYSLATDPRAVWERAQGGEKDRGSEVAEAMFTFGKGKGEGARRVRLIVRRQPIDPGDQLSFDDFDRYRYRAIITNIPSWLGSAVDVEAHHRLRGGIPEDAMKTLKSDFGFCHAPLENFFGNWSWWLACALAYNVSLWLKEVALPESFRFCGGKRLRLHFFNLPARITTSARRLYVNLPRAARYAGEFIGALARIGALPAFG